MNLLPEAKEKKSMEKELLFLSLSAQALPWVLCTTSFLRVNIFLLCKCEYSISSKVRGENHANCDAGFACQMIGLPINP